MTPKRERRLGSTAGGRRSAAGGFTLTELLVTIVIIGILAAVAAPSFSRENRSREARDYAAMVARELQKCRVEALSTRLPVRAFVYADRVELRPWIAGATPGAAPRAPAATDPMVRDLRAPSGSEFLAVTAPSLPAPAGATLGPQTAATIDFTSQGTAQLVGQAVPTSAVLYLQNGSLAAASEYRRFRFDVRALTGYVSYRPGF